MKIGTKFEVKLKKGLVHEGIILGQTINGIQVGLTKSCFGDTPKDGKKYVSIFYASSKQLKEDLLTNSKVFIKEQYYLNYVRSKN